MPEGRHGRDASWLPAGATVEDAVDALFVSSASEATRSGNAIAVACYQGVDRPSTPCCDGAAATMDPKLAAVMPWTGCRQCAPSLGRGRRSGASAAVPPPPLPSSDCSERRDGSRGAAALTRQPPRFRACACPSLSGPCSQSVAADLLSVSV